MLGQSAKSTPTPPPDALASQVRRRARPPARWSGETEGRTFMETALRSRIGLWAAPAAASLRRCSPERGVAVGLDLADGNSGLRRATSARSASRPSPRWTRRAPRRRPRARRDAALKRPRARPICCPLAGAAVSSRPPDAAFSVEQRTQTDDHASVLARVGADRVVRRGATAPCGRGPPGRGIALLRGRRPLPLRSRVPARRARRGDLRLARRGPPGRARALDPCRRRPRALRAGAEHRPVAPAAAGRGWRAVRVQARRRQGVGRGVDARPLEPGARGRSVRRELGLPRLGLRPPRLEPAARRARGPHRGGRGRERGLRRDPARAGLPARGPCVRPAPSARRDPRRRRFHDLRRSRALARQPDRGGRHPAPGRGAGPDRRPHGRVSPRPAPRPLPGARAAAGARRAPRALRAARGPGAPRREPRRGRLARHGLPVSWGLRRSGAPVGHVHPRPARARAAPRTRSSTVRRASSARPGARPTCLRRAPSSRPASWRGWPRRIARWRASCASAASMFCSGARGTDTTGTTGATSCATV